MKRVSKYGQTSARWACELNFWQKKNDPLYIIQCSYQALRYSIVYIDENCQAANAFNNLDGDLHNIMSGIL